MKKLLMAVAIVAIAVSGCVSVESTRAQLNSNNPQEVKSAEETIYTIVTTGKDKSGFVNFTTQQQVEYVKLTSNQELLLRIIDNSTMSDVIAVAIEQLDFSKSGVAKSFVSQRFEQLNFRVKDEKKAELKSSIVSKLTQDELLDLIGDRKTERQILNTVLQKGGRGYPIPSGFDYYTVDRDMLIDRLIAITDSPEILWRMLDDDGDNGIRVDKYKHLPDVEKRLLTMLDKVTDEQMIVKLLFAKNQHNKRLVDAADKRFLLMKQLPENRMIDLALEGVKEGVTKYNFMDMESWDFKTAAMVASYVKNAKAKVDLVATILSRQYDIKRICKDSPMYTWTGECEDSLMDVLKSLPKLSESETSDVLCLAGNGWRLILDTVSPAFAKQILTSGKVKNKELEAALADKIVPTEIDMALYRNIKSDEAREIIVAKMPDGVKESFKAEERKAYDSIVASAKAAAKSTFELEGFYLGMSLDDAKTLLLYNFPDLQITEGRDEDGEYKLVASCQDTPFCWTDKDRKVYQFNFGKQILKKWFKYNAARTMDWAKAFSREHNIELKLDFLERSDDVYLPNAMLQMEPHHVSLHQEIWTYKDGMKNYRVTYFGERKFGGNGPMIKSAAHDKYMYISAPEGTLRAKVEND